MPAIEDAISVYTEGFTGFQDIINENLIKLNANARNWKEAIIASGELLLWEKCISVNYLQQMVQLVDKYGPYIVIANGIAFAHASPSQGSLRNGISVVRLDEPIVFGKEEFDPVRIVVGCSILDSPENINILLKIMKIIKDPSFYETVNHAKHKTDILKIFKETNDSHE
jgi:mannitol/fructose-specific phosphotransferase system IIA component (Ntr-type)